VDLCWCSRGDTSAGDKEYRAVQATGLETHGITVLTRFSDSVS
jgi:hypothetical protein